MQKVIAVIFILAMVVLLISTAIIPAGAADEPDRGVPTMINYQGYLTDSLGDPIEDPVTIIFGIYTASSGGTRVWWETHNVNPEGGLFSVQLGNSGTPIYTSYLDGDRWLGVKVGTDAEMTPRQRLTSVGFALQADEANNANKLDGRDSDDFADTHSLDAADGDPGDVVYVDSDGNVGIGTNNPVEELHVQGTGPVFMRSEVTNDNAAGIQFQASSVGSEPGEINQYAMFIYGNNNSGDLRINEDYIGGAWSPTTRFTIQNDTGNVGIGTSTPIAPLSFANNPLGDKITIWGQTPGGPCLGLGNQTQEFQIHTDASYADMVFGWGTSGTLTETARITGTGYLGVGDFSGGDPGVELHVKDSAQVGADSDSILRLQSSGGNNDSIIEFYENTAQAMSMHYDGGNNELRLMDLTTGTPTPRVTFERSGKVGIGTDSPQSSLHVVAPGWNGIRLRGDNTYDTFISIKNGSPQHFIFDDQSAGHKLTVESGADCDLSFNTNGPVERMRISSDGNVGIGTTTPVHPLSFPDGFGDKISLWGQTPGANCIGLGTQFRELQIYTDESYADIVFGWGSSGTLTETMRIEGTGNVGIGTGTPASKLDVEGDVSADNMPGCEFTSTASYEDIPASWSKVDSIELSVESAGYVIVTFYGSVNVDNSGADVFVGIGNSSTTVDSQLRCQSANIGDYIPFSVQHVYQVPTAGTYTYYGNAYSSTGLEDIFYAEISAIYVPNRY